MAFSDAAAESSAQEYQSMFPEISPLSSRKLLLESRSASSDDVHWKYHGQNVILVDVRTRPEREVSMISGAISLHEFRESILPSLLRKHPSSALQHDTTYHDNNTNNIHSKEDQIFSYIAMYCTVGYRSGIECRKLQQEYPTIFSSDSANIDDTEANNVVGQNSSINKDDAIIQQDATSLKVVNLDGIITFANATIEDPRKDNDLNKKTLLIEPISKQSTNRVHVYGPSWGKYLNTEQFEAVSFSKIDSILRGMRVLLGRSWCLSFCCRNE